MSNLGTVLYDVPRIYTRVIKDMAYNKYKYIDKNGQSIKEICEICCIKLLFLVAPLHFDKKISRFQYIWGNIFFACEQ